jgi:endonuclease G
MKTTFQFAIFFFALNTLGGAPADFFLGGMPRTNGQVSNLRITVITNIAYVVGYEENHKDPAWVAYKLVKKKPAFKFGRPSFGYPMDEMTVSRVPANAYFDSPIDALAGNVRWDHGHMAANNAIMKVFGKDAQEATFKMSNMCPQSHRLNAGKWKAFEEREYSYSQRFGEVYTVCGPIFAMHLRTLTYGIDVPSGYYKILVRKVDNKPKALALTFEYYPAADMKPAEYFPKHLRSIRDIETATGLDFFSELPESVQDELETEKPFLMW